MKQKQTVPVIAALLAAAFIAACSSGAYIGVY
jgi:hypothetical protein